MRRRRLGVRRQRGVDGCRRRGGHAGETSERAIAIGARDCVRREVAVLAHVRGERRESVRDRERGERIHRRCEGRRRRGRGRRLLCLPRRRRFRGRRRSLLTGTRVDAAATQQTHNSRVTEVDEREEDNDKHCNLLSTGRNVEAACRRRALRIEGSLMVARHGAGTAADPRATASLALALAEAPRRHAPAQLVLNV
eukprot:7381283-Prymnesium_polylepis.1